MVRHCGQGQKYTQASTGINAGVRVLQWGQVRVLRGAAMASGLETFPDLETTPQRPR
jgi:hypothetical protein